MKVTTKPAEPVETIVVVEMTLDQARTLQRIFYSVGGDPVKSRRKHAAELSELLAIETGRHDPGNTHCAYGIPAKGQFYFEDGDRTFKG